MNDQDWGAPESEILETIRRVQKSNSQAVIAHVVSVEGSAYRRPGAKMVVSENRVGIGNITAGCLEGEVLDIASKVLATGNPLIQTYDLMQDRDDMWGLGVGCNGVIDILLEKIDSSYQPILDSLNQGKPIGVVTVLSGDVPLGTKAYYDEDTGFNTSENFPDWLLDELNSIEYYSKFNPKSLGIEWVINIIYNIIDKYNIQVPDILRTYSEHIAIQTQNAIKNNASTILITGGGVRNKFLIELITNRLENHINIPDDILIDFKEALIFGFLGVLRLRNENNCLSSVTGASKNHSSGKIYQ